MPDIKVRVGQQNAVKVVASAFGGSLTAENAVNATNVRGGIASVTSIINSGITTLSGPVGLGSDLKVTGISTFTGIVTTSSDLYVGGDLYVADDITLDEVNLRNLNVTGVSTLGITSATWLESQQLNLSGISTFNENVKFIGNNTNMRWNHDTSDLTLFNNTRLVFGDNEDFQIWHGGSHTFLKNTGGDLRIRGDVIKLAREDGSETYLEANVNNEVKLFFNGNEKFATTGLGVTVFGNTETQSLNVTGVSTFAGYVGLSTGLTVAGVTTFNQDAQFKGAAYDVLWDQATSKLKFYDLAQATFGDGNDLQVYSDGTFGIIKGNDKTKITGITELTVARVNVTGVSTFAGIVTTSSDLYVGGDLYISDDLVLDNITGNSLKITGLSTFVGNAQFDGNVSIGGTLTYEDVTNIDSVGLITARSGVRITDGGLVVTAGVSTFAGIVTTTSDLYVGGDLYISDDITFDEFTAVNGNITGILTAATANVTGTLTAGLIDGGSF